MRNIPKTPLMFMLVGFITGIIITRNSIAMAKPERGTAYIAMAVACFLLYRMAVKGKNQAIASAVAVAVAKANAEATANAQAIAQQAVAVYIGAAENYGNPVKMLSYDADTSSIEASNLQESESCSASSPRSPTNSPPVPALPASSAPIASKATRKTPTTQRSRSSSTSRKPAPTT